MLANESTAANGPPNFELPEEVLEILPSDPFEQLDIARKITSIALSSRVSSLESEAAALRANLAEKDDIIADLNQHINSLEDSFSDTSQKLSHIEQEKESLLKENAVLSNQVKKLNRDVSKLEIFKKTLMQSLQEDDENPRPAQVVASDLASQATLSSSKQFAGEDEVTFPPSSKPSPVGNSNIEETETDASRPPRISQSLLLASQTNTPRLTPPGSPPSLSASVSPSRTPKPLSPRRHSISFATNRGMYEDRSSMFSSVPSSQHSSMGSFDAGSQPGRTRIDGKEFFRQVRSRLSYEQFGSFLANVKELNAHKQTKEETLRKAEEIFGPENKDLYTVFEGLIIRNVH
ncbi:uncharacterized protein At4g15545 isoform X2 [Impatiens glandulifera]|uniref:uncharacterized protein At4g15545 isoform X2 n=1 Tax=Impatiens glandulifera TaxID=253017 RepID=UPI001FB1748C|nr:uncharacterized protein At4g15545 isoform X2 [Impatiens glandulifera]